MIYAKDGNSCLLAGRLRPGVIEFLTWAASSFEVVVWTAGREDYAHMARGCLDPHKNLITLVFFFPIIHAKKLKNML